MHPDNDDQNLMSNNYQRLPSNYHHSIKKSNRQKQIAFNRLKYLKLDTSILIF